MHDQASEAHSLLEQSKVLSTQEAQREQLLQQEGWLIVLQFYALALSNQAHGGFNRRPGQEDGRVLLVNSPQLTNGLDARLDLCLV